MSVNLVRYVGSEDASPRWGRANANAISPLSGTYTSITEVLSDGVAEARNLGQDDATVDIADVGILNPLPGARVLCQGANYRSHMIESGMDPDRAFNMLFTKSTGSLTGPNDDIVRPSHVKLLDYEVELGIVVGRSTTGTTAVTEANLADFVGAFVVVNDVSARDVQIPQGQWFKGKSYRTFCPVGPYLCVPDPEEVSRWKDLRLRLTVNGSIRQDGAAGDMAFGPAETISEFSQLEDFRIGDIIATGTPGGVALQPPNAMLQKISALLPEEKRWELFVKGQQRSDAYLSPGDRLVASIATPDGVLDLGAQNNVVR